MSRRRGKCVGGTCATTRVPIFACEVGDPCDPVRVVHGVAPSIAEARASAHERFALAWGEPLSGVVEETIFLDTPMGWVPVGD